MAWPNPADYQEAIQHPELCFADPELKGGTPQTDRWGLPRPVSGAFASVYRVDYRGQKHAVRCFLRDVPDIERRYAAISDYLVRAHLPFMVEFKYLKQGIRVRGQWYPILKMDWVDGERLDTYIGRNIRSTQVLVDLAIKFFNLTRDLSNASIAHGDLQHGNILVVGGELRLIDYDGMFVPPLAGWRSNELGQPNYQHPKRSQQDYGLYLDHFSEWVIYLSLVALAVNPSLRSQFSAGSESLLLNREDYLRPDKSRVLRQLEQDGDANVQSMAKWIRYFLKLDDLKQIPALSAPQATAQAQAQTATSRPPTAQQATPVQTQTEPVPKPGPTQPATTNTPHPPLRDTGGKPDWLADHMPAQTAAAQPAAAPAHSQSAPAQVIASSAPANTISSAAAVSGGNPQASSSTTRSAGVTPRSALPRPAPPRRSAVASSPPPVAANAAPAAAANPMPTTARVPQVEPWNRRGAYTFEYTLLSLSVMCLGLLGMVLSGGMLPVELVAALAGVTALTTATGLAARYQMLPETRQRATMSGELSKVERELSHAKQRLDRLHTELDRVNRQEQQEIDRLNSRQKELVAEEVKQLGRVQNKRQSQSTGLSQRRQQLKQSEQDEKNRALAEFQQQTLNELLDGYGIASSRIPGVGHQAAQQLQQYGIGTAGDFQDVQMVSSQGNPNTEAYFTTRGGKRITIPGISAREALQLLTWRRELEQRLKGQVPQTLPLKQLGLIIAKYQIQHKLLDYQEKRADDSAHTGTASTHQWYQDQLAQVRKQQQDIPQRNKDKRQALHDEISEKQKLVNTRQVDKARLDRDLAPLQSLSFQEYLKHMF